MITGQLPSVSHLSIDEKRVLANQLWNEVEEHQDDLTTNQAIMELVEKRFEDYERDPSSAMTLDDFKRQLRLS